MSRAGELARFAVEANGIAAAITANSTAILQGV